MDGRGSCHLCGCETLHDIEGYTSFRRITSDFRLRPPGGRLGVCTGCGAVQKVADEQWRMECRDIYSTYVVYRQGKGSEQAVFASSGAGEARSQALLRHLHEGFPLPEAGRHLDFGCGDGSLLRNAAKLFPNWTRAGAELNEERRPEIEAIAGVRNFYAGPLQAIPSGFDLVTAVHVVEHFENPAEILHALAGKLAPGGRLFIEVPDLLSNPFDLLIADHATHFTAPVLGASLASAGLTADCLTGEWVARELSAVVRADGAAGPCGGVPWRDSLALVLHHLDWLSRLCDAASDAAEGGSIGLFGTSIAATWVAAHVEERLAFFVDEDAQRIGSSYLGRPVLHPSQVPPNVPLFIAHTPAFARAVAPRLAGAGNGHPLRIVHPPEFRLEKA